MKQEDSNPKLVSFLRHSSQSPWKTKSLVKCERNLRLSRRNDYYGWK